MDDVHNAEASGLPVQGPHFELHAAAPLPAGFCPLRLVLQPGGASIDVNQPSMLVGRHTDCDVRLPLPDVSRRHCRLQFADGGWQVVDLGSLNGIQVNGKQVPQAPLVQGDLLRIGSFTFTVELAPAQGPASSDHVQSILQTLSTSPRRKAS
jgi:pSer/pThr/pTyr-binding forkhead associated (FHA) protein